MRRQLLALRLLPPILSASLLVASADLSWAQDQPPIGQMAAPVFDIAVLHVPVSEAIYPRSAPVEPPPLVEANKSQPRSQARFFTALNSDRQLPIDKIAPLHLRQFAGTAESRSGGNDFIGGTPNQSLMFEPGYMKLSNQTINRASDMDSDGRHIPLVGPIIVRVAQQAEAHPRITRFLKTLHPRF